GRNRRVKHHDDVNRHDSHVILCQKQRSHESLTTMAPKELTRQQISSRLQYSATTPKFLQKLQNRISGIPDEEDYDYDDEFEPDDGSGRPPIPRRPAIPERPAEDPGSADEDDADEKPQVVVLREGKHLTEREAENVRRQERGLAPLPDPSEPSSSSKSDLGPKEDGDKSNQKVKAPAPSLSFSSTKNGFKTGAAKRKANALASKAEDHQPKKKKHKKDAKKTLLSFGDEA
ncbi:unnamed protein product, partial [Mycena citricolor]